MLLDELFRGHMLMEGDGGGGGGGTASGADANGFGGEPHQGDAMGTEGAPGGEPSPDKGDGAGGAGDEGPLSIQLGENTYSEAEIIAAIESHQNLTSREQALQERGEVINALQVSVEKARQEYMGGEGAPHAPAGASPLELTGEQLRDMILENPDGFKDNLGKYIAEVVKSSVGTAVGDMDSRNTAQTHFAGKHPEFNETIRSSGFAEFSGKLPTDAAGNPIYNDVNAFYEYENAGLREKLALAEKAGFKQGEEANRASNAARNSIKVLRGGGGMPPHGAPGPDVRKMPHGAFLNDASKMIEGMRSSGQ